MESYKLDEIGEIVRDLHSVVVMKELELCVHTMYQAFYHQHKLEYGTGKVHIADGESYQRFMDERYNFIFCSINETIEAKLSYQNQSEGGL